VPSPGIATESSPSHTGGLDPGTIKQVDAVTNAGPPDVTNPDTPVNEVNATVPPGATDFDSAVALGATGAFTVGVIVEQAR
jgi:hypothetical protein